ncbi:hypothetical protein NIES2109_47040 [Nostoc sp. HK-01]|nr:hypothetical protein NIES2109_47040 [Nostoc sp. HK-01]
MYTRQYKTKKTSANSAEISTSNQFAPRRFVVQPAEEITSEQTPDLQPQGEKGQQSSNNLANISIFPTDYETVNQPKVNQIQSQE